MIGPFRGGRTVGVAGIADQPKTFYIGVNNGGVWKTDDYGAHLESHLRRSAHRLHRRRGRGAVAIRIRSTWAAARACSGPIFRWATACTNRPTPARPGAISGCAMGSRFPAIIVDPRNAEPAVRRRAGASLRPERRARHLSLHRRRRELSEGPVQGRPHRRHRSRVRSAQSADRLRRALAGAAGAVGERRVQRAEQRPLQIHRWRRSLEPTHRRAADVRARRAGTHRHRHRAQRPESHVRAGGSARTGGRRLPFRRCRRHLEARQRREPHLRTRIGFRVRARRPQEPRRRST